MFALNVGTRIVQLREANGWSQRELAKRLEVNPSVMNRIESGERPMKDHELNKLANVFYVTSDYLLGRSDNPNLTEEEAFASFRNNPSLERWYKELPNNKEEDLKRLKRIWEAFKEEDQ
ncbi:helix-turn-helix domain-containing protein [Virgibacillus pantothenticus]|uniref:helix-turn-helix domain-containing protein n=1 Tax=Virgibacillus pantothenticus TaxID=1473 RepID=UPI000953E028|nr:helix-turn-helix transcriptional regulator [Virgibacillus pantothenticus]MEB5469728.1 helix-turn-helix transcriptional regulator [Virgibacillus pantothenticus]MED3735386.1 helix-turn-helix transcriptional regulator [Virgibacillus pantothenticus]SIT12172.1 Helix-turn-helix domain-containing protein [Virgibacillus pantothenticus]